MPMEIIHKDLFLPPRPNIAAQRNIKIRCLRWNREEQQDNIQTMTTTIIKEISNQRTTNISNAFILPLTRTRSCWVRHKPKKPNEIILFHMFLFYFLCAFFYVDVFLSFIFLLLRTPGSLAFYQPNCGGVLHTEIVYNCWVACVHFCFSFRRCVHAATAKSNRRIHIHNVFCWIIETVNRKQMH